LYVFYVPPDLDYSMTCT